jgi:HNH endonuclease
MPNMIDDARESDDVLMVSPELSSDLAEMINPREREYYWFSLGVVAGRLSCGAFTHFIGWANGREGWELRVPSLVNPKNVLKIRDIIPCLVVEGARQFAIWNALGGHALVERHTTEEFMPDMLEPKTSAPDASGSGFVGVSILTDQELQYAPSRRLRMQILLRDNNRCRSCGRSPTTNPDVELHVHHIRPWGIGGLTHPLNLLTLCQTCHRGLPGGNGWAHYVPKLYKLMPGQSEDIVSKAVSDHRESVLQYRQIITEEVGRIATPEE